MDNLFSTRAQRYFNGDRVIFEEMGYLYAIFKKSRNGET